MPSAPEGPLPGSYPSVEMADPIPCYDPELIADEAVWPAVNELWRGDWRRDALAGHEFYYPSSGMHDHRLMLVTIRVYSTFFEKGEKGEPDITTSHVKLETQEILTGALREVILNDAWKSEPELIESYRDDALTVKRGLEYIFDDTDDSEINAFKLVENAQTEPIWGSDTDSDEEDGAYEDHEEDDDEEMEIGADKFHAEDIENIKIALSILGAPDRCQKALDAIKEQPVQVDERD